MKALLVGIIALVVSLGVAHAADPVCWEAEQGGVKGKVCQEFIPDTTATQVPTSTSVPPTSTPVPPTATSVPSTVTPTPPPVNAIDIATLPKEAGTGRVFIMQPGTYTGSVTCQNVPGDQYCLHAYASGIVLQDFSVTSPTGLGAIHTGSGVTFRRGTITGAGGITGYRVQNILMEDLTFNVTVGAVGIYDAADNCEGLTTKRVRFITLRNSVVNSTGTGNETVWLKCSQDVLIEANRFTSSASWAISPPDALNVVIRGNSFDLTHPHTWLAIELPRVFGALVENNISVGQPGDWLVNVNSGTRDVTIRNNCVNHGVLDTQWQQVTQGLVVSSNGPCSVTPPTTGDGGLR